MKSNAKCLPSMRYLSMYFISWTSPNKLIEIPLFAFQGSSIAIYRLKLISQLANFPSKKF